MTANEVRALEEMEALPGGDKLLVNGNMMPIEMAGEQYMKDKITEEQVKDGGENGQ
jgi:hypothetical protein